MKLKARITRAVLITLRALAVAWCRVTRQRVKGVAVPCWACPGTMTQYAKIGVYHIYQCPDCGAERALPIDDGMIMKGEKP